MTFLFEKENFLEENINSIIEKYVILHFSIFQFIMQECFNFSERKLLR